MIVKEVVLEKSKNEIIPLEDGYHYFWVSGKGAMSADELRIIADELDRMNKPWEDIINNDPRLKETATDANQIDMEPFT